MLSPDLVMHGTKHNNSVVKERPTPDQAPEDDGDDTSTSNSVNLTRPPMIEAQVRQSFDELGVSIADWARERGFSVPLTRMVLAGKRKCLRGQSHQIAVALGLKTGRR